MSLTQSLPFTQRTLDLSGAHHVGLVIVDPGVAFTREGALADPERMIPMVRSIEANFKAMQADLGERLRVLIFLDTHHPDIPEPPYPTHGVIGTGEEAIDPELAWLLDEPHVTVIRKDCINGFVGAIDRDTGANAFCQWVIAHELRQLVVTGDCTDICVSDFVVSALSARNHGLLTAVDPRADRPAYAAAITGLEISVLEEATATFHAPGFHDAEVTHHVGLWLMASRGAVIGKGWTA
jgi:nicotinamidase-related amidase